MKSCSTGYEQDIVVEFVCMGKWWKKAIGLYNGCLEEGAKGTKSLSFLNNLLPTAVSFPSTNLSLFKDPQS